MRTLGDQHVQASSLKSDGFPSVGLAGIGSSFFPGDCWMGEAVSRPLLPEQSRVALPTRPSQQDPLGPCAQAAPNLPVGVAPGKATA